MDAFNCSLKAVLLWKDFFLEAKCLGLFLITQINVLTACGSIERLGDREPCKCFYLAELCLLQSLFPKKPGICGAASWGQGV